MGAAKRRAAEIAALKASGPRTSTTVRGDARFYRSRAAAVNPFLAAALVMASAGIATRPHKRVIARHDQLNRGRKAS